MKRGRAAASGWHPLDAVSRKVAEKIAPQFRRLRAAKGSARELREEEAELNETVEELAEEVAEVKRKAKAARKSRAQAGGGGVKD